METHENRLNKEAKLCVGRRCEGLVERATLVKNGRRGSVHARGLVVALLIAWVFLGNRDNSLQVVKVRSSFSGISIGY